MEVATGAAQASAAHISQMPILRLRLVAAAAAPFVLACAPRGATSSPPAPAPLATPADSAAVVATLTAMFDALRVKDAATVQATMHPQARFTLLRPAPGGGDSVRVLVLPAAAFLQNVTRPEAPPLDEPIRNVRVTVDGPLATAWAEYQVRTADGGVSHCGYDAFHLVRHAGRWLVLNVADSFRRDGCGGAWPR